MADNYINATGLAAIKAWIKSAFAGKTEFDALDSKVDGIISTGGEPNTIESITVNGTTVTPDANKNVALTQPTKTSDLTNDSDYVTESWVDANAGKIQKINVNGSELPISEKTVNITVPVATSSLSNDGADGTSPYASQAWVNENSGKIDKIKVNSVEQTITNKEVDLTVPTKVSDLTNDSNFQTGTEVDTKISNALTSAMTYKGSVASYSDLPSSGQKVGDFYDVLDTGKNYAWDGTKWDDVGGVVDLSGLWSKTELTAMTVSEINEILNA